MNVDRLVPGRGVICGGLLMLLTLTPVASSAAALAREGTVAILPAARLASTPTGLDNEGAAPAMMLAFGFKPNASLEVGIDVGLSSAGLRAGAGRYDLLIVPLLLRGSWTPTPRWDLRPVVHAGVGKELLLVYGPRGEYREHTPTAAMGAVGIQADLSTSIGLALDLGYLYASAKDPALGRLDGGGPFVRAGLYFRWEPVRRLGS